MRYGIPNDNLASSWLHKCRTAAGIPSIFEKVFALGSMNAMIRSVLIARTTTQISLFFLPVCSIFLLRQFSTTAKVIGIVAMVMTVILGIMRTETVMMMKRS